MSRLKDKLKEWKQSLESKSNRAYSFKTVSDYDVELLYYPDKSDSYIKKLGFPGQYPFTRGVHENLYRGKLWTMRQFAGFGSPKETNERFKFLLKEGQTGLSVAFDMPTLMGYDSDHPFSDGEVGHCGVSINCLDDMDILFKDIDLGKISISMTINGPAVILFCFYVALAIKRGIKISELSGTLQNDILKEYIAQKEWIYPPKESIRIITDLIYYCTKNMPKYNPVSVSGYHIREAGSTAIQELAFTLSNAFTYIDHTIQNNSIDVDDFVPRISFFFNAHLDFFEEIAKFRAARRIWAKTIKNKYKSKNIKSMKLRFHTQTAGCTLTAQQPENNITRTAIQALSAVLGGTQSLHTNSMDETLALPSEKAAEIALRTQQILAFETGVANVVDPIGGSYYIETLTDEIEKEVNNYFNEIKNKGGVVDCIESGYFQKEIADSSETYQKSLDRGERLVVGVNKFIKKDEKIDIPILKIDKSLQDEQIEKVKKIKLARNNKKTNYQLEKITNACKTNENLIPHIINAALNDATLGEIVESMKVVFGEWEEKAVI